MEALFGIQRVNVIPAALSVNTELLDRKTLYPRIRKHPEARARSASTFKQEGHTEESRSCHTPHVHECFADTGTEDMRLARWHAWMTKESLTSRSRDKEAFLSLSVHIPEA